MAIKIKNKVRTEPSMASMSDLVFLLLIFFMLTSTMVAPNAIKLLLPASNSRTMEAPPKIIVSINENYQHFLQGIEIDPASLQVKLEEQLKGFDNASIRLESDKTVAIQYVVNVIDIVNYINKNTGSRHKVILATSPKK
jgi:biopolymer transport protein ExbD